MNVLDINKICEIEFREFPQEINKKTFGICNEVYEIKLKNQSYILRMNKEKKHLYGTHKFLPIFKKLQIKTPDIIAEDYSKKNVPFYYQILSKIEGKDIGQVFSELNEEQLSEIAKELANIIKKLKVLPTNGKFGDATGEEKENLHDSWLGVILKIADKVKERNKKTNVLDKEILNILDQIIEKYTPYFKLAKSTFYYDDMCSKNVMISNGKFNGIVDLDWAIYGDYLEAIGRIKACYFDTEKGKAYLKTIIDELSLNAKDEEIITAYAILNLIYWTTEEGIKFNSNSSGIVNWDNVKKQKEKIINLFNDLG